MVNRIVTKLEQGNMQIIIHNHKDDAKNHKIQQPHCLCITIKAPT